MLLVPNSPLMPGPRGAPSMMLLSLVSLHISFLLPRKVPSRPHGTEPTCRLLEQHSTFSKKIVNLAIYMKAAVFIWGPTHVASTYHVFTVKELIPLYFNKWSGLFYIPRSWYIWFSIIRLSSDITWFLQSWITNLHDLGFSDSVPLCHISSSKTPSNQPSFLPNCKSFKPAALRILSKALYFHIQTHAFSYRYLYKVEFCSCEHLSLRNEYNSR